jgi:outer membrane autotransporter protein
VFLGVQLESSWTLQNGAILTPFLKLAWMHDFNPERDVPRSFAELPDISFSDNALPIVSDAADIHAGLQISAGANMTFSLGFDGQIGSGYSVLGGSGAFRVRW